MDGICKNFPLQFRQTSYGAVGSWGILLDKSEINSLLANPQIADAMD